MTKIFICRGLQVLLIYNAVTKDRKKEEQDLAMKLGWMLQTVKNKYFQNEAVSDIIINE